MNYIPIFLASDDGYSPFIATTMASICFNTKSRINFYILDSGITRKNKNNIQKIKTVFNNCSVEFIKINLDEYFKGFPEIAHLTRSAYMRYLIPEVKLEIDRAIYADVDVIFNADIKELYETDLHDFAIGAVCINFNGKTNIINEVIERLGLINENSIFNSGILLIDCKKWRSQNITEQLLLLTSKLGSEKKLKAADQDVLQKYFDGKYLHLPYVWNINSGNILEYKRTERFENVKVFHFSGPKKPWLGGGGISRNINIFGNTFLIQLLRKI